MHKPTFGFFVAIAITLGATWAAPSADRVWTFDVFLEDNPIGSQTFRLTEKDGEKRVLVEASLDVKILFFTAYTYRHKNEERWRDGCLARISSTTDDNGTRFRLSGQAQEDVLTLVTADGERELYGCVRTFAYWNPDHLRADKLLNSQTGEYEAVALRRIGEETITAKGEARSAVRYALESEKFRIDLWYSPEDEWLGLESRSKAGRKLRFVLAK